MKPFALALAILQKSFMESCICGWYGVGTKTLKWAGH